MVVVGRGEWDVMSPVCTAVQLSVGAGFVHVCVYARSHVCFGMPPWMRCPPSVSPIGGYQRPVVV